MAKKVHQIMGIPPQYTGLETPEYVHLPDEDNRDAPVMERAEKDTSARIRRIMLLLGTAGLTTVGILFPSSAKANADVPATPAPVVTEAPSPTPYQAAVITEEPTAAPSSTPAPTAAPTATPVILRDTGTVHIVVYADLDNPDYDWFNPDPAMSSLLILADDILEEATFESYTLPPLPEQEGFTAVGYVMQTVDTIAYLYDEVPMQVVAVGDQIKKEHVACAPVLPGGERYLEVHVLWQPDHETNRVLILDGVSYCYDSPIASEGLCYLAAYPVPEREGMTFAGWYDEDGNLVETLSYFDFYPPREGEIDWWLEGADERVLFLENRDWSNPQPVVLHSEWY